jgi:hypothetical protein
MIRFEFTWKALEYFSFFFGSELTLIDSAHIYNDVFVMDKKK